MTAASSGRRFASPHAIVSRERVKALVVLASPFFYSEKDRFIGLVARMRLPSIYATRGFVEAGGLMSYGIDLREIFPPPLLLRADRVIEY